MPQQTSRPTHPSNIGREYRATHEALYYTKGRMMSPHTKIVITKNLSFWGAVLSPLMTIAFGAWMISAYKSQAESQIHQNTVRNDEQDRRFDKIEARADANDATVTQIRMILVDVQSKVTDIRDRQISTARQER